jgi:hypothetical protein
MKRKKTISSATLAKANKPKTHDDYLASVTEDKRDALQKLRKAIKAAAPKAEECISYQLPAFRLNGKFLAAYGAGLNHCAFYPVRSCRRLKKSWRITIPARARFASQPTNRCRPRWCGSW